MYESFEEIIGKIHKESNDTIWIEDESPTEISFIDDEDFSRPITLVDPDTITSEWIQSHIWIHPSITDFPTDSLVDTMQKIKDKRMLSALRSLVIIKNEEELEDYIRATFHDYEFDEFMDMYPTFNDSCIGLFWYYARCPILLLDPIREVAQDLTSSIPGYTSIEEEFLRGVLSTALHEIYHLAASIRFFTGFEDTEEAAENFCRYAIPL